MQKEIRLRIIKKLLIAVLINSVLLSILYMIPIEGMKVDLCIYKIVTGSECFNCGMTRAFLSILHFRFIDAFNYNKNVIIIFPFMVSIYIYSWYKYLVKK